jgi:hypothetical protein
VLLEEPFAILPVSDAIQTRVCDGAIQKRAHAAATRVLLRAFAQRQKYVVHDFVRIRILTEQPPRATKRMRGVRTVQLLEAGGSCAQFSTKIG